jgi:hypothetical protein
MNLNPEVATWPPDAAPSLRKPNSGTPLMTKIWYVVPNVLVLGNTQNNSRPEH